MFWEHRNKDCNIEHANVFSFLIGLRQSSASWYCFVKFVNWECKIREIFIMLVVKMFGRGSLDKKYSDISVYSVSSELESGYHYRLSALAIYIILWNTIKVFVGIFDYKTNSTFFAFYLCSHLISCACLCD